MNDQQCLLIAISAAIAAGREIMEVYKTVPEVELKADRSPLTQADKRAHETIKQHLAETPYPLLSEEGRAIPFGERMGWDTFWLVDPLDGTKEFIKKNGEFTVNIALVRNGSPEAGVVYAPAKRLFYFAEKSIGSYRLRDIEIGNAVNYDLPGLTSLSDKLPMFSAKSQFTVVASRSHLSSDTQALIDELKTKHGELSFVSSGSSIKLCLVAEGTADIYPRLAPTMEWDTAAGHAVARFAGKKVTEYKSGKTLVYNKQDLLNPWFVVG